MKKFLNHQLSMSHKPFLFLTLTSVHTKVHPSEQHFLLPEQSASRRQLLNESDGGQSEILSPIFGQMPGLTREIPLSDFVVVVFVTITKI